MQPAAHYAAAIEVLDSVLDGMPAEKALLAWSRGSRFAGSKDRAAVRDIVFDALRRRESYSAQFGRTARGLALGRAVNEGEDANFNGEGYGPDALSADEQRQIETSVNFDSLAQEYDFPYFILDEVTNHYGDQATDLMNALRDRAPVDLRVNIAKTNKNEASNLLARDHVFTEAVEFGGYDDALRVIKNPRRLVQSRAFDYGYVELQDLSSQIIANMADAQPGERVLDYCAGGGGKTLALGAAMSGAGHLQAWDINPERMKDLPKRAARAGLEIDILSAPPTGSNDLVFVDAPCSGSGAWRRSPDAKWRFNEKRLAELIALQSQILDNVVDLVDVGGRLVYATCSILPSENRRQLEAFILRHREFELVEEAELNPLNAGDGFYGAVLVRR